MARIVLPEQQWAICESQIEALGSLALLASGPSERSWKGIRRCSENNHKPYPAFYTSTVQKSGYSDWVEFMIGTGRHSSCWLYERLHLFNLRMEEHEVYIVDEYDDYEILAQEYLTKEIVVPDRLMRHYFGDGPQKTFDWVQIALDGIDCIWVRDPHCHPLLRFMDVEQCVWLHMPKFTLVKKGVIDKCDE